jgi:hypothetical protein
LDDPEIGDRTVQEGREFNWPPKKRQQVILLMQRGNDVALSFCAILAELGKTLLSYSMTGTNSASIANEGRWRKATH